MYKWAQLALEQQFPQISGRDGRGGHGPPAWCLKNPAAFLQRGGSVSVWWETVDRKQSVSSCVGAWGGREELPRECWPGTPSTAQLVPAPVSSLALRREMPCSEGGTLHTDFIPLPLVPVSSVVCLVWRCLSLFYKPTPATRSPVEGVRGTEKEGTTCMTPAAPAGKGGCKSCFWQVLL